MEVLKEEGIERCSFETDVISWQKYICQWNTASNEIQTQMSFVSTEKYPHELKS